MKVINNANFIMKADIIAVAMECFGEKGYVATNMDDIAKRVGISRTPLYYHFGNKEQLFTETFLFYMDEINKVTTDCYMRKGPLFEKLRDAHLFILSDAVYKCFRMYEDVRRNSEQLKDAYEKYMEYVAVENELKRKAFQRAIENGEMRHDTDIEEAIIMLHGILFSLTSLGYRAAIERSGYSIEDVLEKHLKAFLNQYAPK